MRSKEISHEYNWVWHNKLLIMFMLCCCRRSPHHHHHHLQRQQQQQQLQYCRHWLHCRWGCGFNWFGCLAAWLVVGFKHLGLLQRSLWNILYIIFGLFFLFFSCTNICQILCCLLLLNVVVVAVLLPPKAREDHLQKVYGVDIVDLKAFVVSFLFFFVLIRFVLFFIVVVVVAGAVAVELIYKLIWISLAQQAEMLLMSYDASVKMHVSGFFFSSSSTNFCLIFGF